ncbi:MFS transporter [Sinorhizobium medicae]|uniref:MFS transporter n=2 Tax=Sinorhizobium medicae TaxID=110321 RepID=UPI000C7C9F4F|nr:MFS transporter [Sinorhizobium medicae]MDX0481821.1 MFS transporter [Sinorhizobium medicae]MDX0898612.1 MFS transporter [Sinorhizobium medicae]MDX0998250.1 MFS transporter [Sinorhizobium medicae]MDX1102898.1 MFS transporter [Sinorhizobium medicae]MDX1106969.1 MFS transporter [Sinorhizobium medicae]
MLNTAGSTRESEVRRVVFASLIGATIEWYDFFLYGVIAGIVFNQLYFPSHDPLVSMVLAYATFAVGFVARPLGGIVFGHFGDKLGRKQMLVLTILIMGVATVLIGVLPTYEQIGVAAPILLLILRIAQGIGIGGEWGGAVLMAYEFAPEDKRGYYASIPQIGLAIGLCLSSGVVALLSLLPEEAFMSWGWRTAFIGSVVLIVVGLYIRLKVAETPDFASVKEERQELKIPFVELIRTYPRNILLGMGARYIDGVFFNVFAVFSIVYLSKHVQVDRTTALWLVCLSALVMVLTIPLFGKLSDRWGRPKTYAIGSLLLALVTFPAFMLMGSGSLPLIALALIVPFGIIYAMCYGPEAALFSDLFDVKVRYTGISFVYQFSGIFASGITPIIATFLISYGDGSPWLLAAYVVFAALVSMISAMLIRPVSQTRTTLPHKPLRPSPVHTS